MTRSDWPIPLHLTGLSLVIALMFTTPALSETNLPSTQRGAPSASDQSTPLHSRVLIATDSRPASVSDAHTRLIQAEISFEESRKNLRKARQRRYPRGRALDDLRQKARETEAALDQAEDLFLQRVHEAKRDGEPAADWIAFIDQAEALESRRLLSSQPD